MTKQTKISKPAGNTTNGVREASPHVLAHANIVRAMRQALAVPRKRSASGQECGRWFAPETLRLMAAHLKVVERELRRKRRLSPA